MRHLKDFKISLLIFFLEYFWDTECFNLDVSSATFKRGPPGSYFGYSITPHKVGHHNSDIIFLVGAPRDNASDPLFSNISRPGVLYNCSFHDENTDCTPLPSFREFVLKDEDYNDQWFGGVVVSQNIASGQALACGHKYGKVSSARSETPGWCISLTNNLKPFKFHSPCSLKHGGYFDYAVCQAGVSAFIDKDGEILLGAPGAHLWRGVVFGGNLRNELDGEEGWFEINGLNTTNGNIVNIHLIGGKSTENEITLKPHSYFGMSISTSHNMAKQGRKVYVVGAPRSDNVGEVLLLQKVHAHTFLVKVRLKGQQMGSRFGHKVLVIDVNGDGLDDLVVGAPLYHGVDSCGGAIYVYMSTKGYGIKENAVPIVIKNTFCSAHHLNTSPTDADIPAVENNNLLNKSSYKNNSFQHFPSTSLTTPPATPAIPRPPPTTTTTTTTTTATTATITTTTTTSTASTDQTKNFHDPWFGFDIVSLGDLDRDDFNDFAVGSPYEGRGRVYIFRGGITGPQHQPSQIIEPSSFQHLFNLSFSSFGFSLASNGFDLDSNLHPDLLIGSYLSDAVVLLRSSPVIDIRVSIKNEPKLINPNVNVCGNDEMRGRNDGVGCFVMRLCFNYYFRKLRKSGKLVLMSHLKSNNSAKHNSSINDSVSQAYFKFYVEKANTTAEKLPTAETVSTSSQAAQMKVFNKTTTASSQIIVHTTAKENKDNGNLNCVSHDVYLEQDNHDYQNGINFHLSYELISFTPLNPSSSSHSHLNPVLSVESSRGLTHVVNYLKSCGSDNICQCDLNVWGFMQLDINIRGYYELTSTHQPVNMNIQVGNKLEDAFSTKLYIILPEQLRYIGSGDKECRRTGTLTVTCDVGNPFPHGKYASVALRLDASLVDSSVRELYVHLIVNSSSFEVNYDDNEDIFVIKVNLSSDVVILANVQPDSMYLNRQDRYAETLKHSKNTDDDSLVQKASMDSSEIKIGKKVSPVFGSTLGDSFEHTFEVKNRGYTKTASLKLHIQVPLICGSQHRDRSDRGGDYESSCRYFIDSTTIEFLSGNGTCRLSSTNYNSTLQVNISEANVSVQYHESNISFHANMGANDDDDEVGKSKESILSKILKFGSGNDSSEQNVLYLTCDDEGTMECISIECSVHPLTRGESAVVSVRHPLLPSYLNQFYHSSPQLDEIKVTSRARVSIPSSQKTSEDIQAFDSSNFTLTTLTIFLRDNSGIQMHVPIWVLVLSISLGVLALLHVVLIMYKCGFFKRRERNILAPVHQATVKKPLNIRQMSHPTRFLPPRPFSR